ncbi:unnamed protein product, partial [Symbiodinium pilosum]
MMYSPSGRCQEQPNEIVCDTSILACDACGRWSKATVPLKAMELFIGSEVDGVARSPVSFLHILATLGVEDPEVISSSCLEVARRPPGRPGEVVKMLWALSRLGVRDAAFCQSSVKQVFRRLDCLKMEELLRLATGAEAAAISPRDWLALQEEVARRLPDLPHSSFAFWTSCGQDLVGIAFMCQMANALARRFRSALAVLLRQRGCSRDSLPLQGADRHVLDKAPGVGVCDGEAPEQLLDVAKAKFGAGTPIFADSAHWHGFLHRLDVPCSGMILVATRYEAFYDLQLQLHTGDLERDYAVLCRGWFPGYRALKASLLNYATGGRGRRSRTDTKALAFGWHGSASFTFAAVRILTGRPHQIRRHMAHVGHPIVHDALYASAPTFSEDMALCHRNWLHRYRLAFKDADGSRRSTSSPLSADLQKSAALLQWVRGKLRPELPAWTGCRPLLWETAGSG